jgi:AraC family transcriptional activator of mar-sox-rob regulon
MEPIPADDTAAPSGPPDIALVLAWLEARLDDPALTATAVLRACGVRSHQFRERFRHVCGVSLRRWIEQQRVERAKGLLQQTDQPVTQVAFAVGYNSLQTFTEAFKRQTGQTPGAWGAAGPKTGAKNGGQKRGPKTEAR